MKAVIMAGGEGARLRPLTCDMPKPMMPVLDRPIMDYALRLLKRQGSDGTGARYPSYHGAGEPGRRYSPEKRAQMASAVSSGVWTELSSQSPTRGVSRMKLS